MKHIQFTFFADGSSDRALLPILAWLVRETHKPDTVAHEFLSKPQLHSDLSFSAQLETALEIAPCNLFFVHRDAEKQDPQFRYGEIASAVAKLNASGKNVPHVCVVPVHMTEAWLLTDKSAIRKAAGKPNGDEPLDLPKLSRLESLPEPKDRLHELLRKASGKRGRRLKSFDVREATALIPESTVSFAPLRQLSAFARLEADLKQITI